MDLRDIHSILSPSDSNPIAVMALYDWRPPQASFNFSPVKSYTPAMSPCPSTCSSTLNVLFRTCGPSETLFPVPGMFIPSYFKAYYLTLLLYLRYSQLLS